MTLSRFTLTSTVTVLPGAFTLDATTGERAGTGSNATGAGLWGSGSGVIVGDAGIIFPVGTTIYADSSGTGGAGALYTAIGSGNLTAYRDGTDNVGHASLGN